MPPAYEVLLLNTAVPQIQAAQAGDTYVVPRDISFSSKALIGYTDYTGVGTNGLAVAGNVGIGTSSPNTKLNLYTASGNNRIRVQSGSQETYIGTDGTNGAVSWYSGALTFGYSSNNGAITAEYARISNDGTFRVKGAGTAGSTDAVQFSGSAPASAMTLDASGNLGIGESSPSYKLHVVGTTFSYGSQSQIWDGATGTYATFKYNGAAVGDLGTGNQTFSGGSTGDFGITSRSGNLVFGTNSTERARFTSDGNLLVGTTISGMTAGGVRLRNANGNLGEIALANNSGATDYVARFIWGSSATLVGNITVSSTATAYNTSSDYRLKENVEPMQNALATVAQLKPVTYTWKADGSAGQGFIAHELQAVVPDCVTGEKDAVDAEGKPVYQGIDTSFLVATLTAAIQEQQALINDLRARLAAAGI